MINVTKTYLPDIEKFKEYVDEIFDSGWITNGGPMVQKLEKKLAKHLGVKNMVLVANGTVALEIAYRVLNLKDFVLTTPFSFVATTSSLMTNGLRPIFVDIDPNNLNMDASKIERSITQNTTAIVPVHVFGNACDVETIASIAKKHQLKVIYDAAHAFDVNFRDRSLLSYGDISTLSFHATKLFHTVEGGALIINDDNLVQKARELINFGIASETSIPDLGTNAKMNEFEAAMGLAVLDEIEIIKRERKDIHDYYKKDLDAVLDFPNQNNDSTENYSYFPVLFESESSLEKIKNALNQEKIFPRRYFYPSLDTLDYIEPKQYCPISRDISTRILCLPIYPSLEKEEQSKIIEIIKGNV